jgi:hypothetical protein
MSLQPKDGVFKKFVLVTEQTQQENSPNATGLAHLLDAEAIRQPGRRLFLGRLDSKICDLGGRLMRLDGRCGYFGLRLGGRAAAILGS